MVSYPHISAYCKLRVSKDPFSRDNSLYLVNFQGEGRIMKSNGELSPVLQSAKDILAQGKKEMHVNDIAASAVASNKNLGLSVDAFATKLSSALAANLKTQKPIFAKPLNKQGRPQKGVYRLKQSHTPSLIPKEGPPPTSNLFLGKAGEYAVMSELLFWGYNVSLMAVDQGIDLVTSKNGRYHHIQVKTATSASDDGPFVFQITQKAFDANHNSTMWYVFVMRKKLNTAYAVVPSSHLHTLRSAGAIGGQNLSIQLTAEDRGRRYMLNGKSDVSMFINRFGLIE